MVVFFRRFVAPLGPDWRISKPTRLPECRLLWARSAAKTRGARIGPSILFTLRRREQFTGHYASKPWRGRLGQAEVPRDLTQSTGPRAGAARRSPP